MSAETNEDQANEEWWSIFSPRAASWLRNSNKCCEFWASAETFFCHQNAMSTGCDEFWSQRVSQYDCVYDGPGYSKCFAYNVHLVLATAISELYHHHRIDEEAEEKGGKVAFLRKSESLKLYRCPGPTPDIFIQLVWSGLGNQYYFKKVII